MKTTSKKLNVFILPLVVLAVSISWSQSEAIYDISVTTTWNAMEHTSVPSGAGGNAHWSDLIGATHNTPNRFMSIGSLATTGIKNVAEFGSNTVFRGEITNAINIDGNADQLLEDLSGFSPFGAIGTSGFVDVTMSEDFPLISLVSMVAPSPDWFIAVNSESLRSGNPAVNNGWKDDFTIEVFAYDSGTDDGTDYTSTDNASMPFVPISMASGLPTNGIKMATISFNYKSSTLGIEDLDSIESIKVYPNPANDILTITNAANSVRSVVLYNVLGKRVNVLSSKLNGYITMTVSDLQSGIYILKLENQDGDGTSLKVIIE